MLIVWFRLCLQQSLIQNTMQTTKREARRNSVNIMDDMVLAYPKRDTSYLGHDETSSGHDVSHMHLTQISSLRTLTEPFRFSRFNIITNIVSLSVRLRVRPPNHTKLRVPCKEGVSGAGFKRTVSCSVRPLYHTKLRVPCKEGASGAGF